MFRVASKAYMCSLRLQHQHVCSRQQARSHFDAGPTPAASHSFEIKGGTPSTHLPRLRYAHILPESVLIIRPHRFMRTSLAWGQIQTR